MGDRRTPLLGRLAVHLGMLSTEQLVECLAEQERGSPRRNLGEIFVVKGP